MEVAAFSADALSLGPNEKFELLSWGLRQISLRTADGAHLLSIDQGGHLQATAAEFDLSAVFFTQRSGRSHQQNHLDSAHLPRLSVNTGPSRWVSTAQPVTLEHPFHNPVVIAGPPSSKEGDAVAVRISDVKTTFVDNEPVTTFNIQLQESANLDNVHKAETVSYFVIEAGHHVLADGTVIQAGTELYERSVGGFHTVSFPVSFTSQPVVFSQVQAIRDGAVSNVLPLDDHTVRIQALFDPASPDTSYYNDSDLLAFSQVAFDDPQKFSRYASLLEFNYATPSGVDTISSVDLQLYYFNGFSETATIHLWGVVDQSNFEDFNEDMVRWTDFSPPVDNSVSGSQWIRGPTSRNDEP